MQDHRQKNHKIYFYIRIAGCRWSCRFAEIFPAGRSPAATMQELSIDAVHHPEWGVVSSVVNSDRLGFSFCYFFFFGGEESWITEKNSGSIGMFRRSK